MLYGLQILLATVGQQLEQLHGQYRLHSLDDLQKLVSGHFGEPLTERFAHFGRDEVHNVRQSDQVECVLELVETGVQQGDEQAAQLQVTFQQGLHLLLAFEFRQEGILRSPGKLRGWPGLLRNFWLLWGSPGKTPKQPGHRRPLRARGAYYGWVPGS